MSRDFGAETDAKYPGLNGNRNRSKPLYGKFPVFRNASFGRTLGIPHILQNFVLSNEKMMRLDCSSTRFRINRYV